MAEFECMDREPPRTPASRALSKALEAVEILLLAETNDDEEEFRLTN